MSAMTPRVILNLPDDDDGMRSTEILARVLQLAREIWANEDKNVERRPSYDVTVTVNAAVELSGAVRALDTLLQGGYPFRRPGEGTARSEAIARVRARRSTPETARIARPTGIRERRLQHAEPCRRSQWAHRVRVARDGQSSTSPVGCENQESALSHHQEPAAASPASAGPGRGRGR